MRSHRLWPTAYFSIFNRQEGILYFLFHNLWNGSFLPEYFYVIVFTSLHGKSLLSFFFHGLCGMVCFLLRLQAAAISQYFPCLCKTRTYCAYRHLQNLTDLRRTETVHIIKHNDQSVFFFQQLQHFYPFYILIALVCYPNFRQLLCKQQLFFLP